MNSTRCPFWTSPARSGIVGATRSDRDSLACFPRPRPRCSGSPCSISPACAPGRRRCASLPTGAPTSSRSRRRNASPTASRSAARATGPDFQNLHRNKRGLTLDLKSKEGVAVLKRLAEKADVLVENFRPDVKDRLGIDYEAMRKVNPKLIYAQHLRLRPGRPLSRSSGLRPDRAGHGRTDVDHRRAGQGPDARRHPDRRLDRRPLLRARHHGGAARAREVRRRPVGADFAAAGADLHARFPGGALADQGRGAEAGGQRSSDQHPDQRLQDVRRLHQHRHHRAEDLGAPVQHDRRAGPDQASRLCDRRAALEEPRRAQRRDQ